MLFQVYEESKLEDSNFLEICFSGTVKLRLNYYMVLRKNLISSNTQSTSSGWNLCSSENISLWSAYYSSLYFQPNSTKVHGSRFYCK